MAQQLIGRGEILDELEEHLRDSLEELTQTGHAADEAVELAMSRMGQPREIAAEFAKVPAATAPWLPVRLAWAGGALLAASMLAPLFPKLTAGGLASLLAVHMGAVMLGYVATLLVGFLAACYFLTRPFRELRKGQVQTLKRAALVLSAAAVVLTGSGIAMGCLFCPHEKTGWAWGLDTREVGGIAILAWNVAMVSGYWRGRESSRLGAMMLLGVAGNIAVALGWLGASAVERQLHGSPGNYTPVVIAVLSQLALAGIALAPAECLRVRRA